MGLSLEKHLSLNLTPALQEAIYLLQLPQLELVSYLEKKAEKNPLLEVSFPSLPLYDPPKKTSFYEHLFSQIKELFSPSDLPLAQKMIGELDEKGYLERPLEALEQEWHIPLNTLQKHLMLLQTIPPKGLFARSLQECLLLQSNPHTPTYDLLKNHFDSLCKHHWISLKKHFAEPVLQKALQEMALLNFHPRAILDSPINPPLIPELCFEIEETYSSVSLLDPFTLHFRYEETLCSNPEEKALLRQWKKEARLLKQALGSRKAFLLNLGKLLLQKQKSFFLSEAPLQPLKQKDLAEALGLHPSSLSRLLSQKSVKTPRGNILLKELLGKDPIKEKAQHLIRQIRNKKGPFFSDQKIAKELQMHGIFLSRRTVQKYRSLLGLS